MKKTKVIDIVKADYKATEVSKNQNDEKVAKWEDVRDAKPYGTEVAHKSKYVSDLTMKLLSWQIPSIVDPFVSSQDLINCKPFTHADYALAEQEETVLTHQFINTLDHYAFMDDLVTWSAEKGTAFVKTGWEFKEEEQEVEVPIIMPDPVTGAPVQVGTTIETQMVTIVNKPTRVIIDPLDIRVDPTCRGNLARAGFIIHDFESDLSSLEKDGLYKNLDELKIALEKDDTYQGRDYDDETFTFSDDARKKLIVHEYWGDLDPDETGMTKPMVITWVNDVVIREEDNPLPGQELPFERAVYKRKPGYIYGEPLAALVAKNQHIDSILHRGIFDDMKLANNGQTGTKKGFTDDTNLRKMKQGLDFEYNTTMADVYEDSYKGLNQSVFNVLSKNEQSAESSVGVSLMAHGGGGNALGSSAAAVNATTTSSAKREMHIVRGIAEDCLIPVLKKFSRYNREFLEPEEIERITDKPYIEPTNDNVFDVKMTLESAETRAAKAQSTGFVLQTMGPNMGQTEQAMLLARYMKLIGEPDIAHRIENPEPDPAQQEAAQKAAYIQDLEIKKLEAEIANELAKGEENRADIALKKAKTREIESNSDIKDLDYLEREQGLPHERELEKERAKADAGIIKQQVADEGRLQGIYANIKSKIGA